MRTRYNNRVLLTFVGFHDPFSSGLVENERQAGPILSLLSSISLDKVVLFYTSQMLDILSETRTAILERYPEMDICEAEVLVVDPTDYVSLIEELTRLFKLLAQNDEHYFIGVASGTPQMHACWLLLAASGEIPARVLYVRQSKYVSLNEPLVQEIDFQSSSFPDVRSKSLVSKINREDGHALEQAVSQLGIIGDHPRMIKALKDAAAFAPSESPMLIQGETGTGKELFARLVHLCSNRSNGPFVPVNCAALPENLIEDQLFGHKRGAFTTALSEVKGKFDLADKGTLFLDELGDLPLGAQSKLLRVLEDGMVEPLGSERGKKVSVRVIAATNKNIQELTNKGLFREDLYYRLCTGHISLPALRERRSDIPKLTLVLLDKINKKQQTQRRISQKALIALQSYSWPGNIRELRNVIESSLLLSSSELLNAGDLQFPQNVLTGEISKLVPEPEEGFQMKLFLDDIRNKLIVRAVEKSSGNHSRAAELLGISTQAVGQAIKKIKQSSHSEIYTPFA